MGFCKGAVGTGDADCHSQCAHWLRNDTLQVVRRAGRCRHRPLRMGCRGGRPCPPSPDNATPCRAGPVCPAGGAGKIRVGPSRTPAPKKVYLVVRRGGALPLPRATARVAPTEGLPIELRRGRRPRRPAPVIRGTVPRAKNKIAPGFCQGRCAAPWYHLASRPAHAGGLMKCRYTSALLRARPSEPKTQEALDPAAPEPCSPVRPAPAFTYSGSLGRSANGVLFPSLPF